MPSDEDQKKEIEEITKNLFGFKSEYLYRFAFSQSGKEVYGKTINLENATLGLMNQNYIMNIKRHEKKHAKIKQ